MTPTDELYAPLQQAFTHFNSSLFEEELPSVIFTTQRKKSVMGYFAPDRWASKSGKRCHEIAINPSYVGRSSLIELMQTMVHEMAHCWQHCYGKPGRRGYHNKQWAKKMLDIGLVPSATGKPGGSQTGERMNDYPAPGGRFIRECEALVVSSDFDLPWVDRYAIASSPASMPQEGFTEPEEEAMNDLTPEAVALLSSTVSQLFDEDVFIQAEETMSHGVKSKYTCCECQANVWGRSGLNLSCNDCSTVMLETF